MCLVCVNVRTSLSLASTLGLPDPFPSPPLQKAQQAHACHFNAFAPHYTHSCSQAGLTIVLYVMHALRVGSVCGGRWRDGQHMWTGFDPARHPPGARLSHTTTRHIRLVVHLLSCPYPRHARDPATHPRTHPNPTSSTLLPRLFHGQDRQGRVPGLPGEKGLNCGDGGHQAHNLLPHGHGLGILDEASVVG